jgi:hypothetical protein
LAYASFVPLESNLNEQRNLKQGTDVNYDSGYLRVVLSPENEIEIDN